MLKVHVVYIQLQLLAMLLVVLKELASLLLELIIKELAELNFVLIFQMVQLHKLVKELIIVFQMEQLVLPKLIVQHTLLRLLVILKDLMAFVFGLKLQLEVLQVENAH